MYTYITCMRMYTYIYIYIYRVPGEPNLSSMHGGCRVDKGVKYTVNIWTFNQLRPGAAPPRQEAQEDDAHRAAAG